MTPRQKQIQKWEDTINDIVTHYHRLRSACDAAIKSGCLDINGQLHESIWRSFQGMLERIDDSGWIIWFIYDNDCGKNAMKASASQKTKAKAIRTVRQLATLIVKGETE